MNIVTGNVICAADGRAIMTAHKYEVPSDEREANLRLFAAAPDLLAENRQLREALAQCKTSIGAASRRSREMANKRLNSINEIVHAALADANEGRAGQ